MSELYPIGCHARDAANDVVFVHGLGGHWLKTWAANPARRETFWPTWIADQLVNTHVWSLAYEANRSNWRPGLSLLEHTDQVLELLLTKGFGSRPILFVAHSLGGLLVKNLMRASFDSTNDGARKIAQATRGIAFFATPNSGSYLVSSIGRILGYLGPLGQLYRPSRLFEELRAHSPELLKLNQWYRDRVSDPKNGLNIHNKIYYEKRSAVFGFVSIVNATSADPGIAGIRPVPVATDHFGICKFPNRECWLYESVLQFLSECLIQGANNSVPGKKNALEVIELKFDGNIPPKLKLQIDSNFIINENITLIITHGRGPNE